VRDQAKYGDIAAFVKVLPRLREKLERDLASPKLDKTKVVAAIVHILEATRIRIGNDEYARSNRSYGLTTLLDRHATIRGATVALRFRGKSGKEHQATILDRRLAAIVKRCRDIPGQRLFQYIDEAGDPHPITSTDVNDYLREAMGLPFTAKVFRTWAGTLGAALLLARSERSRSQAHGRRQIKAAIEQVSKTLGNTPAICRSSYVHPMVFDAYLDGTLHDRMRESVALAMRRRPKRLDVEECAVLHLVVLLGAPQQALPVAA
jgi:DNA topoisomerase-1